MAIPTPLVEIKGMHFAYNGEAVLQNVNLEIHSGDFIAMIGPNGGGKTTLLKLILGLLKPDEGRIRVMGQPVPNTVFSIGYVPQHVNINSHFPISAIDIVTMGMLAPHRRWHRTKTSDHRKAMAALERLEIGALANRKVGTLSGGQRQRVFIARALVTEPELLLLDEPTANIDTKGQVSLFNILNTLNSKVTILIVSHDLLVISRYVKSVACVNRHLHYHNEAEITGDMIETMYPCETEEVCPVELVAHGLPHRVLKNHER